jgi:hypothetical protein
MTRDIPTLITQLKTHLVALGDVRDCRTENEQVMLRRNYDSVQRVISGLMNEPQELERHQAALDQWQAESLASLAKQSEIEQAIADAPDYTIIADARKRDHEQ